jgi:hypothetical protein
MASVTAPATPTRYDAALDRELSRAAERIRFHDVLTGGLGLAVLTLGYAIAAILLDRWLVLPDWVRQVNLAVFLLAFAGLGYVLLVRPLRRSVNPRFAARRVESTVTDAKNAVINWVDLRERELPDAVRTAVGARAIEGVADADVHKAVESKKLIWLGVLAGLLVAVLAVLFVVLKPNPFLSLVGRAFNPFAAIRIASRTELTLTTPESGDATVTAGEPVTIAVYVGGSIPDADSPDRVRLLVRHNPESAVFDEFPLEPGASAREFTILVPQSVVQNGFWYKVVAGDAAIPEYRISVRTRPLVRGYEVHYEYPPYLRMPPSHSRDPALRAYRGTTATLEARTNRTVKRGWMQIDGRADLVPGEVVGESKDTLRFRLTLAHNSRYRIGFTAANDEPSEPTSSYPIRVVQDNPPTPQIDSPPENQVTLPANGLLKIDGTVGDDIGIESIVLRMTARDPSGKIETPLQPKPYQDGKPFPLEEKMTIEYWLEATDNCAVKQPDAKNPPGRPNNIGISPRKIVLLGPPEKSAERLREQQGERSQRTTDEARHRQQQDERFRTEPRNPPAPPQPESPPEQPKQQDASPAPDSKQVDPKAGAAGTPKPKSKDGGETGAAGKEPGARPDSKSGTEGTSNAKTEPKSGQAPPAGPEPPDGSKPPETTPTPRPEGTPPADPQKLQEQARQVEEEIKRQNQEGGAARPSEATQPSEPPAENKGAGKPDPMEGSKSEAKSTQPGDATGSPMGEPAESRPTSADTKPSPMPGGSPPKSPPEPGKAEERPAPKGRAGEPETRAADGRGDRPVDPAASKTTPEPSKRPPETDTPKPSPESAGPMKSEQSASASRGDGAKPQAGAAGQPDATKGEEKPLGPGSGTAQAKQGKADPKQIERDINDLASGDPQREQDARDRLERTVGKEGRQRAEKAAEGLKSKDQKRRNQAEDETRELARELGEKGDQGSSPPTKADMDVERLIRRKADDLASDNPQRREEAEKGFDDLLGKKDRERLQQAAKDAKSGDPGKQEQAKKDIDELAKKASRTAQQPPPTKEQIEELAKKAGDLNSKDPDKRKAAEDAFDRSVGEEKRKELQQNLKDLASEDKETRDAARKRLEKAVEQARKQAGQGGQPSPDDKALQQAAQDLDSDDPNKKAEAERKLDETIGKKKREEIQKGLASGDRAEQESARKQMKEALDQAQKQAAGGKPSAEDLKKLEQAARDLNSPDPQKKAEAEKTLDQTIGEDKRKEIQKGLASDDQKQQELARKRMQEAAEKGAKETARQPSKEEIEKLAEQAKDLASNDPEKRKQAEKEFDEKLGRKGREELQKNVEDLMSGDPNRQKAALDRLQQEMAKQTAGQKDQPPRPLTEDEIREWQQKASDLTSADSKKKAEAEKAFDEAVGKENREKFQKQLQEKSDLLGRNDVTKQAAEDAARKLPKPDGQRADRLPKEWRPGPAGGGMEGQPLEDDPRNRLKSAELQLKNFKENRDNTDLQNRLGYTPEQYEQFRKGYEEMVGRLRQEVDQLTGKPEGPKPAGPATQQVGEGSGGKKFSPRADGTTGSTTAAGPGTAPPGYSDAQRRFAEEAAKRRKVTAPAAPGPAK